MLKVANARLLVMGFFTTEKRETKEKAIVYNAAKGRLKATGHTWTHTWALKLKSLDTTQETAESLHSSRWGTKFVSSSTRHQAEESQPGFRLHKQLRSTPSPPLHTSIRRRSSLSSFNPEQTHLPPPATTSHLSSCLLAQTDTFLPTRMQGPKKKTSAFLLFPVKHKDWIPGGEGHSQTFLKAFIA